MATTIIDAFDMQSAGWHVGQWASSIAVRCVDGTISGYTRQASNTKDDSSTDHPIGSANNDIDKLVVRYVRNYYTLPPSTFFEYFRMRVDLNDSYKNQKEDGFRQYNRIYKHNQGHYVSGPCTVEGLIPHTFIHQEEFADDEVFTYPNAVNLNAFRLEFKWQATFGHVDVQEDLELLRLSIDSNNYIRLLIVGSGSQPVRRYHITDVFGGHDPTFKLEKVRGGSLVDSVEVVCYYGYDNRESSIEVLPDTLIFTIDHLTGSGGYLALGIDKFKNRGRANSTADITGYSGNSMGDVIYNGIGYYTHPRVLLVDQSYRTRGRKMATLRNNLHLRFVDFDRQAISIGERDPTSGQRVSDNPYELAEDFTRSNSGNLGDNWDIISTDSDGRNAGDGFDVNTNKARAYGSQFERWDADTQHSNFKYKGKVMVQDDNDLVGLLGRYLNEFFSGGEICGYGCELVQTGASAASIRIVAWWLSNRTVLDTASVTGYSEGTEYEMHFTLNGSTLTGELFETDDLDTPIGTITVTSTLFTKPGRLGIYCEAPVNFVTVDDLSVEPMFAIGFDE